MGAIAGSRGGIIGVVAGIGAMLSFVGPIYLSGAYARSKTDDKISGQNIECRQPRQETSEHE